ncbi:glycerol-3-phosphate 1-O-acyltransferase PlsY [Bacillus solimangrovi]|uniref:Glycerol-3-phosphate acyltransferase n=1 Tax=Bacillus solimangrovi TaxID=1305675 RepID=A0A1E5LK21_9BACI|nr:glycerol-3-phosphate 1-O-acyltransferase PlsY [Bacillus solimangrovi]OEH94368.1 glycerol-3-phosphate acyltransferase [Bacillus solimangrovi]
MTTILIIFLLAYLLGSIPSGLIVGKVWFNKDIREHGSGNLGATNTFRILGLKAGFIVTIADILKGTLAASLPLWFGSELHLLLAGIGAVIGHTFPIFANFRGGKAVATSAGVLLAYDPILFLIILISFFIVLYLSKYVSLSSMIAGIPGIIYSIIIADWPLVSMITILEIFVVYRHRANISRIINKTEPKIKWM